VVSGKLQQQEIVVGNFQKFLKLKLNGNDITEIVSVTDTEGNEYYEVDYLSQDTIYKATLNRGDNSSITQNVMRPFVVPRRFVTERTQTDIFLQFGFGTENTTLAVDSLADPSKVVLKVHGKDYVTDATIDPGNFLKTDKFGVAPSNTTLTVVYRENNAENVNISSNALTTVDTPIWDFKELASLNQGTLETVVSSLEVNNSEPITGDVMLPSTEELKTRIYNVFSSQNRAVTAEDYRSLCYGMPAKFGGIKRVNIVRDPTSLRRNLNLYAISEGADGTLIQSNSVIKQNLKQWLNQSKMISDTIDILDAKIINIGIEFTAIASLDANKFDVLNDAILKLSEYYNRKFEIGQPFYVSDIYSQLNKMKGIIDVTRVNIVQKTGTNYSSVPVNINMLYSADGSYIDCPQNAIFEIKYLSTDVKGTIK
jgi:phage-related baseplate assembly protein